ncbi:hypothetical protein Bca4012_022722 [Brassica carinata]
MLLQGSMLTNVLKTIEDIKPLVSFLFQHNVSSQWLQLKFLIDMPLLFTISSDFIDLATTKKSSLNINNIVSLATVEFNLKFFGLITTFVGNLFIN